MFPLPQAPPEYNNNNYRPVERMNGQMPRKERRLLYLFLIVTSVTPAASATSFCVMSSPSRVQATYKAEAASPIGSFPAEILSCDALKRISRALRCVLSVIPALDAILDTHLDGSATGILMSSSFSRSLYDLARSFLLTLLTAATSFKVLGTSMSLQAAYSDPAIIAVIDLPLTRPLSRHFL